MLDGLSEGDRGLIVPHLTYVLLPGGQPISLLINSSPAVCFPLGLIASAVQITADGGRFDVGLIGSEGVLGWSAALGDGSGQQLGVAQLGGGSAMLAPAALVAEACRRSPTLHTALLAFLHSFMIQMSHTIVANLRDGIERRLARWLLMLHDRVEGDALAVTHGELASALHVRRASITDTLHVLEGNHIVRCTRGQIIIRDRTLLTLTAGDSYGPAEASYRALIGDFGKR